MAVAPVTREQFEIRSEVEVVHIPTGADFRAYPYSDPDDILQSVKVSWGRDGGPAENTGEYAEQVRRMASQLLLERAHQVSRGRRFARQHDGERYEHESNTAVRDSQRDADRGRAKR